MIVQSWDTAIKAAASNDASVCCTFERLQEALNGCDKSPKRTLHRLVDVWCDRVEYPELKRQVVLLQNSVKSGLRKT